MSDLITFNDDDDDTIRQPRRRVERLPCKETTEAIDRVRQLELMVSKNRQKNLDSRRGLLEKPSSAATPAIGELAVISKQIITNPPWEVYSEVVALRKMLSVETGAPISQVLKSGVIPRIIKLLASPPDMAAHGREEATTEDIQYEAAWVLTNIASGTSEQTKELVKMGGLAALVNVLKSMAQAAKPNAKMSAQCVWGIGNIAGDSPELRNQVLRTGVLKDIVTLVMKATTLEMLRNGTWCISNLCRGKPAPPMETIAPALPVLARLVFSIDDEVLTDSLWAISYFSDGTNDRIQAVIEAGVTRRLIELVSHPLASVYTPAIRVVGNLLTGDDIQTQTLLEMGVLDALKGHLDTSKKALLKEVLWAYSNITAGTPRQIQAVINSDVLPTIVFHLKSQAIEIKKEAAWVIGNLVSGGKPEQLVYSLQCDPIAALCELLPHSDKSLVSVVLETLTNYMGNASVRKISRPEILIHKDQIEDLAKRSSMAEKAKHLLLLISESYDYPIDGF